MISTCLSKSILCPIVFPLLHPPLLMKHSRTCSSMQNSGHIQWNTAQINAEATSFQVEQPILSLLNMMTAGQLWTSCVDSRQSHTAHIDQIHIFVPTKHLNMGMSSYLHGRSFTCKPLLHHRITSSCRNHIIKRTSRAVI